LALLLGRVLGRVAVEDFAVRAYFFNLFFEARPIGSLVTRSLILGQEQCDLETATPVVAASTPGRYRYHHKQSTGRECESLKN
jgi:hypothetical protein